MWREQSSRTLARTHSENYSTNLLTTKTHSHTFTIYRQINSYPPNKPFACRLIWKADVFVATSIRHQCFDSILKGVQLVCNYRRCFNFSFWLSSQMECEYTTRQDFNFSLCSSLSPHVACFSLHKSQACLGCHAKRNQWYAQLNKFRIPSKAHSLPFLSGTRYVTKNRDASKKTFSVEMQGMLELSCLVHI